jgi:Family of unknown function (DUF5694)
MMNRFVTCFAFALSLVPALATARTPAFDPREWKVQHAGPPTQVLTLGSTHLGQIKTTVTPEMLTPLLDKLAAFKPDIITHEGISGHQCQQLREFKARYPDMWATYCWPTDDVEMATGLSLAEALVAVETTLKTWPAQPTAAQRRKLASLLLAAGDRPSAQVQWLQLAKADRIASDGINAALLKILARDGARPNETYDVAVALAARLGHNRVYAVDDHTADSIQGEAGEGLGTFLQGFWGSVQSAIVDEFDTLEGKMKTGADVLAFYRFTNLPTTQREFIAMDFKAAMNKASPGNYGRIYNAWNETRNLRMVSNIRAAFGNRPGARVLNVVGASHKAYYDAYLDMMSDVQLVDASIVLQ